MDLINLAPLFRSLKKGHFFENYDSFKEAHLRHFMPLLFRVGFCLDEPSSSIKAQLFSKLIDLPNANKLHGYAGLDFAQIQTKCIVEFASKSEGIKAEGGDSFFPASSSYRQQQPFAALTPLERVYHICAHLICTRRSDGREQHFFAPFHIESFLEECGWILSLLTTNLPELFHVDELVKQLLCYETAPLLILPLVLNQPDLYDFVLDTLAVQLKQPDEDSFVANQVRATLLKLFQLDPVQSQRYTGALMDSEKGTKRTVQLLCSDWVDDAFFVDSLVAQFSNRASSELVAFLTRSANKVSMRAICQRLGQIMNRCRKGEASQLEGRVVLLISLLASGTSLRLSNPDSRQWVAFLTRETLTDDISLKIALATILASPNLMPDQISFRDEVVGQHLIDFFVRLHSLIQSAEYQQLSNVMILVYLHLITDNADELANLLSNILGHKVPKTLAKQPFVRELYISHAITEQDMAQKAAKIPTTPGLNATLAGYLPVHCIASLLHWRSFSKYSTPIQKWVLAQLRECHTPVHPMVATLLENYASSCIPAETFHHFNQSIDEQSIQDIFASDIFDDSHLVLRLLVLAYLLAFSYKLDTASQSSLGRGPLPYSTHLWKQIPIRYLLLMADQRHSEFEYIRPLLQRYVVLSMPHLLPEQNHFEVMDRSSILLISAPLIFRPFVSQLAPVQFESALDQLTKKPFFTSDCQRPSNTFYHFSNTMDALLEKPVREQFAYFDTVLKAMNYSLDGHWPRTLVEKLVHLWTRFDSVVPRRLHEETLRLWLQSPHASAVDDLDQRDNDFLVAHTPLILFRADSRVFRSPPHLRCFCRTLAFYLAASKDANSLRLARAAVHCSKGELEEKEALLRSFIGTQRLAVVQVFIELCDGKPEEVPELKEIREIICAQIHQYFIADMHLPKLVHFNMYSLHLIPVIVRGVPSAHVLINSIGELITGGNLERRVFSITLMAELLEHYKIPSAFAALTLISDLLDTLLCNLVTDDFILLLLNVAPALARFVRLSPFHAEHFLATMERARKLSQSRLAVYATLTQARDSPEKKLLDLLDRTLAQLPNWHDLFGEKSGGSKMLD